MKKAKVIILVIMFLSLAGLWIIGCSGDSLKGYDITPEPTGTSTPPPTPSPTGTGTPPQPGEEKLEKYATGRANAFDLRLYEHGDENGKKYIYWVERSTTPQGGVFRILSDGTGEVETVVTGLNKPSAMHLLSSTDRGRLMGKRRKEGGRSLISHVGELFSALNKAHKLPEPSPGKGHVVGTVKDHSDGSPIQGVKVQIDEDPEDEEPPIEDTTDNEGKFELPNVIAGTHELEATKSGYKEYTKDVTVRDGETTTHAITLIPITETVYDYLFVSDSGTPSNGVIWRVNVSKSDFPKEQLTTGMTGDLIYMKSLGPLLFTRDAGGASSAIHETEAFPDQIPAIPEDVDASITNAYGINGFSILDPDDEDPDEIFAIATERISAPNGRVLMYNFTGEDIVYPLTPFEVSSNEQMPTKVTFQPVYTDDNKNPVFPMEGYVYWTNYSATSGQVVRQKVKYDKDLNKLELDGAREIVVDSLKFPYDIKVPHEIATGTLRATLNKVYVSINISKAEGGNWLEVDVSDPDKFPLKPSDNEVKELISENVEYPFNGVMEHTGSKITLYFTSYNDNTGGNNDGIIYYWYKSE